jgi:hypothetical protein
MLLFGGTWQVVLVTDVFCIAFTGRTIAAFGAVFTIVGNTTDATLQPTGVGDVKGITVFEDTVVVAKLAGVDLAFVDVTIVFNCKFCGFDVLANFKIDLTCSIVAVEAPFCLLLMNMLPGITIICCCCWFAMLCIGLFSGLGLTVEITLLFNDILWVDAVGSTLIKSTTIPHSSLQCWYFYQ